MLFLRPNLLTRRDIAHSSGDRRMAVDATTQLQHYDLIIGGKTFPRQRRDVRHRQPDNERTSRAHGKGGRQDVDRAVAAARKRSTRGPGRA